MQLLLFKRLILSDVFVGISDKAGVVVTVDLNDRVLDLVHFVLAHSRNLSRLHCLGREIDGIVYRDRNEKEGSCESVLVRPKDVAVRKDDTRALAENLVIGKHQLAVYVSFRVSRGELRCGTVKLSLALKRFKALL